MRRYRAPQRGQRVFFADQSSADCITNMSGFDFRQAQEVDSGVVHARRLHGGSVGDVCRLPGGLPVLFEISEVFEEERDFVCERGLALDEIANFVIGVGLRPRTQGTAHSVP